MLKIINQGFPPDWLWEKYNSKIIDTITQSIDKKFKDQNNLFVNTTWFGPSFDTGTYQKALEYSSKIDNLFLYATVDPLYIAPHDMVNFIKSMGNIKVFWIGNFDNSQHEFNFFAHVLSKEFIKYNNEDLILSNIHYKYINYNRKPRKHRVDLVKKILEEKLDHCGVNTLGKPDIIYDQDSNNTLFLTVGEKIEDYVKYGHWFDINQEDPTGIPHDVLSLHNMKYWQNHFLNIVSCTLFNPWEDVFVSESQFKPIIGLRPFILNGNTKTYQWLRDRGFYTFNHYFDFADLESTENVHENIIKVLHWLDKTDNNVLLNIYQDMLPLLIKNKERFYEFALEESKKINDMFK